MNDIEKLIEKTRNSSFNKSNDAVSTRFNGFVRNLIIYTHYDTESEITNAQWLKDVVPEFQRENNQWSKEMQTKFIENILSGVKTEIYLFRMDQNGFAQIIDGLQRTTAILAFFDEKIKPFGYSYVDLKESLRMFNTKIQIRIYTFDTWKEVGQFYIDINENITHSKEDIDKAKNWFKKEKNIDL